MPTGEQDPTETLLGGRYQLGECIGEGGMARVHRGYDVALGRSVAIKLMRGGVEAGSALERARGEMTVLASLSHPSLVTLFDARIAAGQTSYLVMELVEGPTLSAWLEGGPLSERDVAHLGLDLAEALHVVHSAGIVHRDIKPSNVLLTPTDLPGRKYRARLADFGIAYLVDTTRMTVPGQVVGTAAYLAPEQVRGAAPAPPSDVYALGLLLFEAITGQRAFAQAAAMEALVARVHSSPAVPEWIGPEWADLLRRMMALEPQDRPTAIEVAGAMLTMPVDARISPALPLAPVTTMIPATAAAPLAAPATAVAASAPATAVAAPASADLNTEPLTPPEVVHAPPAVRSRLRRRRSRRPALLTGAAAALVGVIGVGAWAIGNGAGMPTPAATDTAVIEPSAAPSATPTTPEQPEAVVDTTDQTGPVIAPVDAPDVAPEVTTPQSEQPDVVATPQVEEAPAPDTEAQKAADEQAKAAERSRKAAEQAQAALDEARKQAEQAQKAEEKALEKATKGE
jgi:hypothetical protein